MDTRINKTMTMTYRGRTFTVTALQRDPAVYPESWTESVAELMRDGTTADWDGSGLSYHFPAECIAKTVGFIMETVDDDAADDSGS